MTDRKFYVSLFILCISSFLALSACKKTQDVSEEKVDITYTEITWDELLPEEELQAMQNPERSIMQSFGFDLVEAKMVEELDSQYVKLPGFIVPLEMQDDAIIGFFLVPYFGACIHTPPPPKNQMLYIKTEPFILDDLDAPIWVEGQIKVEETDSDAMGVSGYTINADKIELY